MRRLLIAALLLAAAPAAAQRKPYQINAQTPEGLLLQRAGQEEEESKKIALYEEYLAKHPQHDGVTYALVQLQPLLLKAKQYDKVIQMGEQILKAEPENAPAAYNVLQACEQKQDAACVIAWSAKTVEAAKKMLAAPKPADEDEAATWKQEQDYATQVITRAEYSLYAQGLQATDLNKAVQLFAALEAMNIDSQYMPEAGARYFVALLQLKDMARAQKLAETMAAKNKANDDMLLFLADLSLTGSKDYAKAAEYAARVTELLPSAAAPQGMDAAAWENKKKSSMGRAYWIAGVAQGSLQKWAESEQAMRAALPLIESNKELLPGAYFYLGLSNYKMAEGPKGDKKRMADARKYTTLCAQMKSPFQGPAQKNLQAMAGK
jgi:hypothetical protein